MHTNEARTSRLAAVVRNPIEVDLDSLQPLVAAAEADAGWQPTQWFPTSEEDPGVGATREALAAGADLVIAAGGDGTVRAVAETLHGSDTTLALLPSGTGNLLARNLDLTLDDAEHSITAAFTGKDRDVDLGMIRIRHGDGSDEKRAFLVMAGLGIDAQMIANTDEELKKMASWLVYVDAIRRSLRDKNHLRMRFRLDKGESRTVRAHTIIVGNCGSLPGNVLLLPDAAIDDGVFDVVLLRPEGFIGWLTVAVKVFWENGVLRRSRVRSAVRRVRSHLLDAHLWSTTGRSVRVHPDEVPVMAIKVIEAF